MAEFMTGFTRTHYCGELRLSDVGKEVTVCGWVQRQRDLGQLIFIDLRDRTGILQLAFDDSTDRTIFEKAFTARAEFVLAAKGIVKEPGPAPMSNILESVVKTLLNAAYTFRPKS